MFKDADCFDLALALYHWLQHNWSGQGDSLYSDFCTLSDHYRPARSEELFDNIGEDALYWYNTLTLDNVTEAMQVVLNYKSEDL